MAAATIRLSALLLAGTAALAACSGSGSAVGVDVQAARDQCSVAPAEVRATQVSVNVNWSGEGPGEVYLYGSQDGAFTRVVGEVEDLTDGRTTSFTAEVTPGDYEIACKYAGTPATDLRRPLRVVG